MAKSTRVRGVCVVPDCGLPHCAKGYCKIHYYRLRRTGELFATQFRRAGRPCRVEGCARPHLAKGLCQLHYDRQNRHGDIGPVGTQRRPRKSGDRRRNRDGYVLIYLPSYPGIKRPYYVQEHRLVMERALGRPLEPFESPHHRNGRRDDNRPENLELWAKPQPAGQRVEDLVAWVVAHYPALVREALEKESYV